MHKILIIQTASIGDVILASSLIESLKDKMGNDLCLDFMLRKGYEGIFEGHPHIRKIICWDKKEKKYSRLFRIWKEIRKEKYDHVINLQRFGSSGFIAAFSRAKCKRGFKKNPFSFLFNIKAEHHFDGRHETERNHELIKDLCSEEVNKPVLYPQSSDFQKIEHFTKNTYICIAPASLWSTKQYPEEKWKDFLDKISDKIHVYLLGSESDKPLCESLLAKNRTNLAGELKLLETASLMKHAGMNFVNDSAPLHIASAMNAPVTALFCSTLPSFGFFPLSEDSVILEKEDSLSCRPCGIHGHKSCPENHFRCAIDIKTEKLIQRLPS